MKLLDLKENDKMDLDNVYNDDLKFDDFELCLKDNKSVIVLLLKILIN